MNLIKMLGYNWRRFCPHFASVRPFWAQDDFVWKFEIARTTGGTMRFLRLLTMTLIVTINLSACQLFNQGGVSTESPAENTSPTAEVPAVPYPYPLVTVPGPSAPYPYPPVQEVQSQGTLLYPELQDGDSIEWYQASGSILSGYVTKVVQTHDKGVFITLTDGRTLKTVEPEIDDVIKLIQSCGDFCKNIVTSTE
jgi:hypothetical protein